MYKMLKHVPATGTCKLSKKESMQDEQYSTVTSTFGKKYMFYILPSSIEREAFSFNIL